MQFKLSDIITHKSYQGLCEETYEGDNDNIPKKNCIIWVPLDHIASFFKKLEREKSPHYFVVVSSSSDLGLALQSQHSVWMDLRKWIYFVTSQDTHYTGVQIPPRCHLDQCRESDKYSIKMHSFTFNTFNKIPKNIKKWFLSNPMCYDERIQGIPFGIAEEMEGELYNRFTTEKSKDIYINFHDYTYSRLEIKEWAFIQDISNITLIQKAKDFPSYLFDLQSHRYIICPEGNGVDCYRTLESIYCGGIPVLQKSPLSYYLKGLPCILLDGIKEHLIVLSQQTDVYEKYKSDVKEGKINFDKARLSYWKREIEEAFNE